MYASFHLASTLLLETTCPLQHTTASHDLTLYKRSLTILVRRADAVSPRWRFLGSSTQVLWYVYR